MFWREFTGVHAFHLSRLRGVCDGWSDDQRTKPLSAALDGRVNGTTWRVMASEEVRHEPICRLIRRLVIRSQDLWLLAKRRATPSASHDTHRLWRRDGCQVQVAGTLEMPAAESFPLVCEPPEPTKPAARRRVILTVARALHPWSRTLSLFSLSLPMCRRRVQDAIMRVQDTSSTPHSPILWWTTHFGQVRALSEEPDLNPNPQGRQQYQQQQHCKLGVGPGRAAQIRPRD